MYENFTQRCAIHGHNELLIGGLCVKLECLQIPPSCQTCNQMFHSDHIQDVKTSNQIKQYLQEMEQKITNILTQYEEIWKKIQTRYKQFYSHIASQKLLVQSHLKKQIETYPNQELKSLSDMIRSLKTNRALQDNVVNKNLQQLKLFYQFFQDTDYVYPFTFKQIKDQQLNPEETNLRFDFQNQQPIDIYPNIDKIQEPRFKFLLKVLEIKKSFQIMLYSGSLNESLFTIDQEGKFSDNHYKQLDLGQKIIKGTILILQFSFGGQTNNVKIEIIQQNKEKIKHIYKFLEKYKLKLVVFSDEGHLQILHDLV